MEKSDISLKAADGRFNYRVGAIILRDGHLLTVKSEASAFYYTVGGRVKFGESSREALLREVREETGMDFAIGPLCFVHENFFTWGTEPFHEVGLYYRATPLGDWAMACESVGEDGTAESLCWLPVERLAHYRLFPDFLGDELSAPREGVRHYVSRGDKTALS